MMELILGFAGFASTFFLVFVLTEANLFFEEFMRHRFELRKGNFKKIPIQSLLFLTNRESFKEKMIASVVLIPIFISAAMLPGVSGKILFSPAHSFWMFILVMLLTPVIQFFLQLLFNESQGDLLAVRSQEKSMAGFTLLLITVICFTLLTAADDISEIVNLQRGRPWLVFQKPSTAFLLINLIIVVYYVCQQRFFSKSHNVLIEKESEKRKYTLGLWKTVWLLFISSIFLGGNDWSLFPKVFLINTVAIFIFQGIAHIREDQAEAVVIWEMTPMMLFFVLLTLVFVGMKI